MRDSRIKEQMRTYDELRGRDQLLISFDCPCGREERLDAEVARGTELSADDVDFIIESHIAQDIAIERLT